MDKTKHSNVTYVDGCKKAGALVNDKKIRDLTELDDELFEIELAKRTITFLI